MKSDLPNEQRYIDYAYERLDAMRQAAIRWRDSVIGQGKGTPQAIDEREVINRASLRRLAQLDIGDESLVFGRLDRIQGETFYVGRVAVSGERQEPLVVDWRAPVAEAFYRATGREPMGLERRRHFNAEGRKLLDYEDEYFRDREGEGDLGLAGPGALVAALQRARTGQMRDIVATVQREQDEIIRADLPGVLVVQGGPGTGKTAVALHRAAYLLFTHRQVLERRGVLVIGPNPIYLRYIDRVLPALGESGVELRTIVGLSDVTTTGADPPLAVRVKGDARMAKVIARAVVERERPLSSDVVVRVGGMALRIGVADSQSFVGIIRRRRGTHNARRVQLERLVLRHLRDRYRSAVAGAGLLTDEDLFDELREHEQVGTALDRMWPLLTPKRLLHDLFGVPRLLELATRGILSAKERDALARDGDPALSSARWTPADLPLLDDAHELLGRLRRRRGEGDDDLFQTYGHIVIDEAQDLSPMQLRMLARRSLGSMTIVGDLAQATGWWAPGRWDDIVAALPTPRGARVTELTVNYRTPEEIMALAGDVLAVAAPNLTLPRSVRATGDHPVFIAAPDGDLVATIVDRTRAELTAIGEGTIAVIAPVDLTGLLTDQLRAAGIVAGDAERDGIEQPVTVISLEMAKGLEFDAVVAAEPGQLVRESAQGLRGLYVAFTRATRRLTIVHAEPLPPVLADRSPGP